MYQHQLQACLWCHGSGIKEGITHSHIMIRVHHSQQEPFSTSTEIEQKALSHTALIGNDHLISIQGLKQLRDISIRVANVQEGKVAEEAWRQGSLWLNTINAQVALLVMRWRTKIIKMRPICSSPSSWDPIRMNSVTTVPFSAMNPRLHIEIIFKSHWR